MSDNPNRKALFEALEIFRGHMRPFIIRGLKRIRGGKVEDLVRDALSGERRDDLERALRERREVGDFIDVGDFPMVVKRYWNDVFRAAFVAAKRPQDVLREIAHARNIMAHPGQEDMHHEYTLERLDDIANILSDINAPEASERVQAIKDALMPFTTNAHKFRQGGRDVYAFTLDLETLDRLLPERVEERIVRDANRPLTPSHAMNINKYLQSQPKWLLGTLLLGIASDDVGFVPYVTENKQELPVGKLTISDEARSSMKMFDGQHRRRAIHDALVELAATEREAGKLVSLKRASLPIMLYAESRISALQQMFADAAQTRTIERNTITRFDQTDAFNLMALRVADESALFAGRVELESSSITRTSQNIIAINQLAMALKALEVGVNGRVSRTRNQEYMLDLDSLFERCIDWADRFLPSARDEYRDLTTGDIENDEIPLARSDTMAYNATVIRVLAGCYYEWTQDGHDWKPLADFLRGESLKPRVTEGSLLIDAGIVAPGGISPVSQIRAIEATVGYIVQQARTHTDESQNN